MIRLKIEHAGAVVGIATADDSDEFSLQYDESWLQRDDAFAVSVSLPLRSKPWPSGDAHPFFANLLPEGVAREALCERLGVSPQNDAALLAALGDDTAGAFRFVRQESEHDREPREREPISVEELEKWASGEPAFLLETEHLPRLSLAGAQHKTTVVKTDEGYALAGTGEASTHILKFHSPRFPHLCGNEFITTKFAANLGLEVVKSELSSIVTPPFLVVERYDRELLDGTVHRLHQEDFCQAFGLSPSRKYEQDGGVTVREVAEKLREISAQPAADLLRLIRWVVFCAIAGNADGHAKNLSILYSPRGLVMAPAYDLVCTRAYPRIDPNLAFSVGGRHDPDRLTRSNWEAFSKNIGVHPRLVFRELERMLEEAGDALAAACAEAEESLARQHVVGAVRKRIRAVAGHL